MKPIRPNPTASNRRSFLHATMAGVVGAPLFTSIAESAADESASGVFAEPARDLPLVADADVIVCGAGPAGVAAAIASARAGARTRLFEVHGCLGGVWTAGLLTWMFDFDKPGLTRELTHELDQRGARRGTHPAMFVYEPDEMKLLLEDLCTEAGVQFRLSMRKTWRRTGRSRFRTAASRHGPTTSRFAR